MSAPREDLSGRRPPEFGEPAPLFIAATDGIDAYNIGVAGGRWMVLMVFGSLAQPHCREAHDRVVARRDLFNDADAAFFGVSADPADRSLRGLANSVPGLRYFWDFDLAVSRLYGLVGETSLTPAIFLIDRALRIVAAEPIAETEAVLDELARRLAAEREAESADFAPILILPRIFEPELCQGLIDHFRAVGGTASGFAADVAGVTTTVLDPRIKRRSDVTIEDGELLSQIQARLQRRLFPMLERAMGWRATEIERFLICRYDAADDGFFSAHRDDATVGTAHRKFAVTVNLNADDYEGGELRFPEFGRRLYKPPTGGAAVFSCSLLHEATPVTRGIRYCFVPFLFDAAGERLRRANLGQTEFAPRGARRERRAGAKRRP